MAKNPSLDTCFAALGLILVHLLLASCSMPRITVLKDPLTPEEHINLGLSYEKRGEYGPAMEQYETAARKMPLAYRYIGNLFFQQEEYDRAEAAYRNAIKKTDDAESYNNLAWLYYTTDSDLERAEELARKAVSLHPDSADFRDTLVKIQKKISEGGIDR